MQLKSLAAVVSIALTLGVQAAPNGFDRALGLKDTFKRSYSHGVDMGQVSKRGLNLAARKRELNNHRRGGVGKRCTTRPKPVTVEANAPSSSDPSPAPSPTPEPTDNTSDNNNNGSGSNDNNSGSGSNNSSNSSSSSSNTNNSSNNSNNDGSTTLDDLAQQWLDAHNTARSNHGASPLTWSNDLANAALSWASGCVFKHSGGTLGPFGENLAAQTGSMTPAQAVQLWMNEVGDYDPNNPQPSHFTQVVWKGSSQLGCTIYACESDKIFPNTSGTAYYGVCEYSPPGNVIGEFADNVQK